MNPVRYGRQLLSSIVLNPWTTSVAHGCLIETAKRVFVDRDSACVVGASSAYSSIRLSYGIHVARHPSEVGGTNPMLRHQRDDGNDEETERDCDQPRLTER